MAEVRTIVHMDSGAEYHLDDRNTELLTGQLNRMYYRPNLRCEKTGKKFELFIDHISSIEYTE